MPDIDFVKSFTRNEEKIKKYLLQKRSEYFASRCYKILEERYFRLTDSNDMRFNDARTKGGNAFRNKVSFPLVKERSMLREAIIAQNFRGDPLITVDPAGDTTLESAKTSQDVMASNFKTTRFREKAFRSIVTFCSRYGSAVGYTYWCQSSKKVMRTVNTPWGVDRMEIEDKKNNAITENIHILDYFQDAKVPDPEASTIQGHIQRTNLAKLMAEYEANPDVYIKSNMKKVIAKVKKAGSEDADRHENRGDQDSAKSDFKLSSMELDKTIFYAELPIKGNTSQMTYYIEMVGDDIIRMQHNPNDLDVVPYSIFTYYKRIEYWWGNADSEFVLPHENFMNLLMGLKADNAVRAMNQLFFYEKGIIDTADWNNRHKNGGYVGVNLKDNKRLGDLIYQTQPVDTSLNSTSDITREIKENMQRVTPAPDFQRGQTQGGIANRTATAAMMLDEQGDVKEAYILEGFQYGLKQLARNTLIMLQQHLPDAFRITPDITQNARVVDKAMILGNYHFRVETALTKNKNIELQRKQNVLTMLMNFLGSQRPEFQNVNLVPIIRDLIRSADVGDVDEIYPAQNEFQQPNAVPSQMGLGGPEAAAAPAAPQGLPAPQMMGEMNEQGIPGTP